MNTIAWITIFYTIFISHIVFPNTAFTKTYYVAKNGSDSNPGTEANPWLTIQKAADTLDPGETVLIRQGVYQERLIPGRSGTEGNYITYRNYGSEQVIIDAQKGSRETCIRVKGKKYLKFIGLRLTGASGTSGLRAGFHASDHSSHLILENLTADNNRFGILLHGKSAPVSRVAVKGCTIRDNTGHGVFLYRKVYDTSVGPQNRILFNAGEKYTFGIEIGTNYPGNPAQGARNIVIFENEIDHNGVQGVRTWNAANVMIRNNYLHHNGATGIQIEDGSENIVIENNRCEFNAQTHEYETGIWVDSAKKVIVSNNFIRGNKIGLMVTDSSSVILRRNLVIENNRGVPHLLNAMGLNINKNTSNVAVVHNTFFRNGARESQKGGITMCAKPPVNGVVFKNNILSETKSPYDLWVGCKDYVSDYNLVYNTRGINVYWLTGKISWSNYLVSSEQDAHSIIEREPKFIFPEDEDFQLQRESPGVDAGDFLTRTVDSGNGNIIQLLDASFFTNGFGLNSGDVIKVGANRPVTVREVDYTKKTITVDQKISWNQGDGVSYPYSGSAPDMGAFEYWIRNR